MPAVTVAVPAVEPPAARVEPPVGIALAPVPPLPLELPAVVTGVVGELSVLLHAINALSAIPSERLLVIQRDPTDDAIVTMTSP